MSMGYQVLFVPLNGTPVMAQKRDRAESKKGKKLRGLLPMVKPDSKQKGRNRLKLKP
jgi:hypothetical protein